MLNKYFTLLWLCAPLFTSYVHASEVQQNFEDVLNFYKQIENTWVATNMDSEASETLRIQVEGTKILFNQCECFRNECRSEELSAEIFIREGKLYQKMSDGVVYLFTRIYSDHLELADIDKTDLEKSIFDPDRRENIIQYTLRFNFAQELHRETSSRNAGSLSSSNRYYSASDAPSGRCQALFLIAALTETGPGTFRAF